MPSVDVLTINAEPEDRQDIVKIAEDARSYFPAETWDDIRYLGKLSLEYDIKIMANGKSFEAFLFEKLTKRIKTIKNMYKLFNLLLAVTLDPVIAVYYLFDGKNFRKVQYLVHDYVAKTFGIISFFQVSEESSTKVVAHGLGHSQGLRHHLEPSDLMHPQLLRTPTLQVEGFCKACLHKLTKDSTNT